MPAPKLAVRSSVPKRENHDEMAVKKITPPHHQTIFRQPEKNVKRLPKPQKHSAHTATESNKTYRLIIKEPYIE